MFGLDFGELFIVGFVFLTVVGAPYAGRCGEALGRLLSPRRPEVEGHTKAGSGTGPTSPVEGANAGGEPRD